MSQATYSANPLEIVRSFLRYWQLISQMTKREVVGRYRGSLLGIAWSFFHPLLMLAIYTFVFSFVFKLRWNVAMDSKAGFALTLFIGLIVYGLFAESIIRAPNLILTNVNYVKKVVFPLEILPYVVIGSALFHTLVSLLVWILFYFIVYQTFQWTAIFFPIVFLPLVLFTVGACWFLASIGVYLRDVGQVIGVFITILLFLSPVFYPASRLPEPYRMLLFLNPLTFIIEEARKVLIYGKMPHLTGLIIYFIISIGAAVSGHAWFQKTRKGFADVL